MKTLRTYIIFSSLLGIFAVSHAQQVAYPDYVTVVNTFYDKYTKNSTKFESVYVDFAKESDGWHVISYKLNGEVYEVSSDQLFWYKENNAWAKLNYTLRDKWEESTDDKNFSLQKKSYQFDVVPFYGYKGWYNDVIKALDNQPQLSDTLLYALAKAYYEKASGLINDQYGYAEKGSNKLRQDPPNALSPQVLNAYTNWAMKGVDTYKRLEKQNPLFETFVGYMNLQIGNEYMANWLNLYIWQNEAAADAFLVDNLYDEFIIDFATMNLQSCPPNAILFTNGDTDTYPLLYLQKKKKIRPDVSILNLSLLSLPEYDIILSDEYKLFKKSLSAEQLKSNVTGQIMLQENPKGLDAVNLAGLLKEYVYNQYTLGQLPGNTFKIESGKQSTFQFKLNSPYILRGDLVELDIIAQNIASRPICYASTVASNEVYRKYLSQNGMVTVMDAKKSDETYFDENAHVELLLNVFQFHAYPTYIAKSNGANSIVYNWRYLYGSTATNLAKANKKATALALLDKITQTFPPETYPVSLSDLSIADAYAELKVYDKARSYYEKVEKHVQNWQKEAQLYASKEVYLKYIKDKKEAIKGKK